MPSLERFFDPQMRKFDANVRPLPGARLYFFESGTTTPQPVFQDKQGEIAHTNPVVADSTGVFPQIFLDNKLYRAELRSSANIVQPGWPIDNIGQDSPIVPFGPWSEIVPYAIGEVVTAANGNWYQSIGNDNLGNEPSASPSEWEVIPIPVSSSFTSDAAWISFSDDGDQISLDVDSAALIAEMEAGIDEIDGNLAVAGDITSNNFRIASRATDNAIASSTTLTQDAELTLPDLESDTFYAVRAFIRWTGGNTTTNGMKLKISGVNITTYRLSYLSNTEQLTAGVGDPANMLLAYDASVTFSKLPEAVFSVQSIVVDGYIKTSSSASPSLHIEWSQVGSNAIPTTISAGSYISAMKL